ncbi:MAG: ABC transporter ATP-binding protein/permease [Candidatus Brocadiaceae bacterium]|nr:ABC transporter ATP-binding protein/permease [Candidatus Brocadiaceae bacterium]
MTLLNFHVFLQTLTTFEEGILAFFILSLTATLFRLGGSALLVFIRSRIEREIRRKTTESMMKMSWTHYLSLHLGDIGKAIIMEGFHIANGAQLLLRSYGAVIAVIGYFVVSLIISVKMTVYTLCFASFIITIYCIAARKITWYLSRLSPIIGTISTQVTEIFGNLKYYRSTGNADRSTRKIQEMYDEYAKTFFKTQVFSPGTRFLIEVMATLFVALFLFIGVRNSAQTIPALLVFLAIFYRMIPRVLSVQEGFFNARTYYSYFTTWKERLAYTERHVDKAAAGFMKIPAAGDIVFKDVTYQYPNQSEPLFHNLNLSIKQGEFLGVVGMSGSGKSTLVDLVTGLVKPVKGNISINQCCPVRNLHIPAFVMPE